MRLLYFFPQQSFLPLILPDKKQKTAKLLHSEDNQGDITKGTASLVTNRTTTIRYRSRHVQLKSVRFPVKVVVTELEDGSRAALVSTSKRQIPHPDAQNHFMLLVSIVYLIFNDLKSFVSNSQKICPNPLFFETLDAALSILSVIKPKWILGFFLFFDSFCFTFQSLHSLCYSVTFMHIVSNYIKKQGSLPIRVG
jgi:hypothetical protein